MPNKLLVDEEFFVVKNAMLTDIRTLHLQMKGRNVTSLSHNQQHLI